MNANTRARESTSVFRVDARPHDASFHRPAPAPPRRRRRSSIVLDAPIFSGHSCAIAGFIRKNFIYARTHTRHHHDARTHRQSPPPSRIVARPFPARARAARRILAIRRRRQYHPSTPHPPRSSRARTKSRKNSPSTISLNGRRARVASSSTIATSVSEPVAKYRSFPSRMSER